MIKIPSYVYLNITFCRVFVNNKVIKRPYSVGFSYLLNVSNRSVSKWETGLANPDISFIPQLADFFKVSIDTLFNCRLKMPANVYKLAVKGLSDDASVVDMWEALHIKYPNDSKVEKELIIALWSPLKTSFCHSERSEESCFSYLKDPSLTLNK